ncbi:hypothetical protein SDC9_119348 [bioreactor metagenome]|uniref:Uncharacterized protein n=1 Tax=bioreactor metagenome TaxID=1076179 RepID=A0A645C9F1_9ZZZZ
MLDRVLETFGVVSDYDLNIMKDRETLFDITTNVLNGMLVCKIRCKARMSG